MPAVVRFGLPLTLLLVVVSPAAAQPRGGPGYFDHPENRRDAAADSARTLGGPWQLWTHAGIGWVSAPARVRERYKAGLVAGLSGDRRFGERVALRGRLDFNDLPPSNPQYISTNGISYTLSDYGHGWLGGVSAGLAVRSWRHLWLEGGFGYSRFASGFGDDESFPDPFTGEFIPLPVHSGWSPLWNAAVRYEFQPTKRDRLLAEVQLQTADRDGPLLRFLAIRFGYRAF